MRRMKPAFLSPASLLSLLSMVLLIMAPSSSSAQSRLSHDVWGEILERYVSQAPDGVNRVDYGALKDREADREALDRYIAQFAEADFDAMSRDEQFAAWANLYNAVTVRYIVGKYPIDTIKPWYSTGPWKSVKVEAGGETISLHGIEHDVLRVQWSDDPRLHYAINCASYSCPNLRRTPWEAATLDADLDDAARDYVNHPRGVLVRKKGLLVSSIYNWFRKDFGGSDEAVIEHLLRYAGPELASQIRARPDIAGDDYDWSLNDTAS